jgi:hypothetical protein
MTPALVPGIITLAVAEALQVAGRKEDLLPLPEGCFLVAPELRQDPRRIAPEEYDRLAIMGRRIPWLAAYASYHCRDHAVKRRFLWEQARREFQAGAFELASRLLYRVIPLASTPVERGVYQLSAQSVHILDEQFERAAELPVPDARLPAELSGWLWHTKGWALAMLEKPAEAETCLKEARELLAGIKDREEYLYLMNISALNRLKLGDWKGSLDMENEIRSSLERVTSGLWQIRYINSLNLARLHKCHGDFDEATRYYDEAFATQVGLRSDSDAIYRNVCLARLAEARGRSADALSAWARAAMHWVSSEAPEAVGKRVTSAILGFMPRPGEQDLSDTVSEAFVSHLMVEGTVDGPSFVRADALEPGMIVSATWYALEGPGCIVLAMEKRVPPVLFSQANARLRGALAGLLRIRRLRTIVVDDQLGYEMPTNKTQILLVALRLGIRRLHLCGSTVELDERTRRRLESGMHICLSSAVDRVNFEPGRTVVIFKRYREPQVLSDPASQVLKIITDGNSKVETLRTACPTSVSFSPDALLRALERDRIITLDVPSG